MGIEKVYFVQAGDDGPIKIGFTADMDKRIRTLQTSSPYKLKILAAIPAERYVEKELHSRYKAHRLNGEWFENTPKLLADIEKYKNEGFGDIKPPKDRLELGGKEQYRTVNKFQLVYMNEDYQYDILWFPTKGELMGFIEDCEDLMHVVDAVELCKTKEIALDDCFY